MGDRAAQPGDEAARQEIIRLREALVQAERVGRELRASEHTLREAIDTALEGFVVVDRHGVVVEWSLGEEEITGIERDEAVGRFVWEVLGQILPEVERAAREAAIEAEMAKFWATGEATWLEEPFELEIVDTAGEPRRIQCIVRVLDSSGGRGLAVVSHDVTAERLAEAARHDLEAQVMEARRREGLSVIVGGVTHQLNGILAGIMGYAELALDDVSPRTSARRDLVLIQEATRRAAELCRALSPYTAQEQLVTQALHLGDLVERGRHLLDISRDRCVTLAIDLSPELPAIEADEARLIQVLMNLVANASQAMVGQGKVTISAREEVVEGELAASWLGTPPPGGRCVCVRVVDQGPGIDPEDMDRLFEPLSSGVGLSAVRGFMRAHGGALHVHSEPGEGTTVRLAFPPARWTFQEATEEVVPPRDERRDGVILLVDDDEVILEVSQRMLEREGYRVVIADDGPQAAALLQAHRDEVLAVVLDLVMPGMDGAQVFARLREIREDVPIVLSSGYAEQEALERFGQSGLDGYLRKPYQSTELIDAVQCALADGPPLVAH